MEFTTSSTVSAISKTLKTSNSAVLFSHFQHPHYSFSRPTQSIIRSQLTTRPSYFNSVSPVHSSLRCFSASAASFASGGSGGGIGGGDGPAVRTNAVPGGVDDVSPLSSDVIILDVGGMSCGGCAASVKRILESQPQVSSASVNLTTETAVIWPITEAKVAPNWQKNLGDELAKHLTTCGFKSNTRGETATEGETLS